MKITKEIRSNKGITMISLIVTIVVMFIIASATIYTSMDRFEVNNLKKMYTDIELLDDKVANYYLEYNGLPVLRNATTEEPIKYTYTALEFEKSENDNENYYIIDLNIIGNMLLNYGEEGFDNPNTSEDVYIINEKSHVIYYVLGIELEGIVYHTISNDEESINDNIPPSKPEIKVIAGTADDNGTYLTEVKLEIIPGNDSWSGIDRTIYSVNGSAEADISTLTNNIYDITADGTYEITAKSYDENGNLSENTKIITVNKKEIVLDKTELSLEIGSEGTATAELTATLENVTKEFKWAASEDSGLIISGEGNTKTITATKVVENATITISYGAVSTACNVNVTKVSTIENQ